MNTPNSYRAQPDDRGHFGDFGGRYVAETLMPLILDLERLIAAKADPAFQDRTSTTCSNIMSAARARSISPSG